MKKNRKIILTMSVVILAILIMSFVIMKITNVGIFSSNAKGANGNNGSIDPNDIKKGITIAGVTGILEDLDTSDATATPEDILAGKTAYVNGVKITGTAVRKFDIQTSYTESTITIKALGESLGENVEYEYFVNGESKAKNKEKEFTTNITLQSKEPYVPSGFIHTEGTVNEGYVIKDVNLGNEFVWVPAKCGIYNVYVEAKDEEGNTIAKSSEVNLGISELTRVRYDGYEYTKWHEDEGNIKDKKSIAYFKQSVAENGGFYMGRYEMSTPGQVSGSAPTQGGNIQGIPVCIPRAIPWTEIDYDVAKENLESMYNGEVQSAMLNSYARTTTVNWIYDTTGTLDYNGNFIFTNVYFKGYCRLYDSSGNLAYEYSNYSYENTYDLLNVYLGGSGFCILETAADIQRGNMFVSNNIYDLIGNTGEWSTEIYNDTGEHRISGRSAAQSQDYFADTDNGLITKGLDGAVDTSSRPILYK